MKLKIYQVDAFAEQVFQGNPASVVPLNYWLEDVILHKIALENNLSETAFYVKEKNHIVLRWFTPSTEVDFVSRFFGPRVESLKIPSPVQPIPP